MYMFNNRSSEETDYILFACKVTHFFGNTIKIISFYQKLPVFIDTSH